MMAIVDNNSQNRGIGKWKISTYNPSTVIGPVDGCLIVSKDFYVIYKDEKMNICLFNVPSQNVAFAYNELLVPNLKIEK
jgi:hypothetical protein